jgi:hypothetical protein
VKTYWLHILADRPPQSDTPTYLLIRANAPERNASGGSMPTVHYPSSAQLGQRLSDIGIDGGALQNAKEDLDFKGGHTIAEVILSDEQVPQLGFVDVAA